MFFSRPIKKSHLASCQFSIHRTCSLEGGHPTAREQECVKATFQKLDSSCLRIGKSNYSNYLAIWAASAETTHWLASLEQNKASSWWWCLWCTCWCWWRWSRWWWLWWGSPKPPSIWIETAFRTKGGAVFCCRWVLSGFDFYNGDYDDIGDDDNEHPEFDD